MNHITPKKSLGQHFLHDKNIAKKIVELLSLPPGSIVLEIGPGTGVLTDFLLEKDIVLYAVEVDTRSIDILQEKYANYLNQKLFILNQDILKVNFEQIFAKHNQKLYIIGNIPYYITSPILFHLFDNADYLNNAVLMVQKEIALRLKAKPRTKDYGILTLAREIFGEMGKIYTVPASCFLPPPKVTSAFFEINFRSPSILKDNQLQKKKLINLIRTLFEQRRKMISNSIKNYVSSSEIYQNLINCQEPQIKKYLSARPEELSLNDYVILYNFLNSIQK
ncbi:MAG: 16S rRNA (adenine(1518)-N(6)/adenine(1519)-N(6))-dimethyltransferase RsmA [Candidatus Kapaibacteriota bacterium]